MAIKMQGSALVDASRAQVWKYLFEVDVLKDIANKIPGIHVERLVQVSDDKYEGTATIGVAMVKGKYDGTISVVEKRELEYVKFHGEGKGGGNWTSGDAALTLGDQDGKTLMQYEGVGNVSGPLASLGQRLIDTVGKKFVADGVKAFGDELAARSRAEKKE